MIAIIQLILLSLLMLQSGILWGESTGEDGTAAVSIILNPMPEFDPFTMRSRPTPEFFPDETEKRVRKLLIQNLTEPNKDLIDHVRYFKDRDSQLSKERNRVTGLTDHVMDLNLTTIRSRSEYLAANKEALDSASTDERKNLIQSRIRNDELTRAHKLLKNSNTNRVGSFTNRLLKSVDLVDIASGSYLSAAVDTTVAQVMSLKDITMPIGERQALALYRHFLKLYPEDPEREKVEKLVEGLEKKKRGYLTSRYLERSEDAADEGDLHRAQFQLEMAYLTDPELMQSDSNYKELRKRLQGEAESNGSTEPAKIISHPGPAPDSDIQELFYALTLRDAEKIQAQAKAVEDHHPNSDLGESAKDAQAVAMEIQGRHDKAKKLLRQIASSSPSPHQRQRAKALLESRNYNLLESVHKAQNQYRLDTVKYVLLGEDFLEKNMLIGLRPLMAQGIAGVNTWGLANLIFMGTNLFHVMTAHPVSDQPIIDKAVTYIRNHPDSESTTEVYGILAEAYEDRGNYDKAIAYHRLSGAASEEKITALKESAASSLLDRAKESKSSGTKEFILRGLLEFFPDSTASKEAHGELAKLMKPENRGVKISKQFLMENPELYMEKGLGLKPSLFDGENNNMELADQGINLISNEEILFHFDTPWGIQSRPYLVRAETIDRFERALRKKNYQVAMSDIHTRPVDSRGGYTNLPDKIRKGNGQEGTRSQDGTDLRLVKRAKGTSPTYPKVLDYELLSKNEQNPGSMFEMPEIKGTISANDINVSGALPTTLWGESLSFGSADGNAAAGLQLPIPLLQNFIPVDFFLQGSTGRPSLIPQIHTFQLGEDATLFR